MSGQTLQKEPRNKEIYQRTKHINDDGPPSPVKDQTAFQQNTYIIYTHSQSN